MRSLLASVAVLSAALVPAAVFAAEPSETTNTIGMQFVLVQPGAMQVGVFTPACPNPNAPVFQPQPAPPPAAGQPAPPPPPPRRTPDPRSGWSAADYEACAKLIAADARPGFKVEMPKAYYLGKFEVTQAQWARVIGKNPSTFQGAKATGDYSDHPVETVTWKDAQTFVAALNRLEHTKAYRLPTEFEWEYACRAGEAGQQSWKEIRDQAYEGGASLGFGANRARRDPELPPPTTAKVGSLQPNAWGLYDMLGNVWEWVQDPYNDKLFPDPKPASSGVEHALKGGGFASDSKNAICATHGAGPGDRWDVGFRVVKDVK